VARPAQQTVVFQAALAAAVGNRHDVVGLPPRTRRPPGLPRRTIRRGRLCAGPFAVRLDDIQSAEPARPFVALLDLAAHVRGAAPDLPFVDARVAAERPAWALDGSAAPPADRLAVLVEIRFAPLISGDDARPKSAHASVIGA
jgi:hypothetical protein